MSDWKLKEGERLDDLVRDGMKLIQRPDQFCFSIDSVLLAHYPAIKEKIKSVTWAPAPASSPFSCLPWAAGTLQPWK